VSVVLKQELLVWIRICKIRPKISPVVTEKLHFTKISLWNF